MKNRLTCLLLFISAIAYGQVVTTSGKEFWFGFMENHEALPVSLEVYISAVDSTGGTISIPGRSWSQSFSVEENSTQKIIIPLNTGMVRGSETTGQQGVYIESEKNVTVYALNKRQYSADAAVILPIEAIGKEYIVTSYKGTNPSRYSQFLIVGTADGTEIEITPSKDLIAGHSAGVPYTITLDQGETYQVQSNFDLTGSIITSTFGGTDCKNFAVFSGNEWTNVGGCGGAQDHLYEQMFPTNTWGKEFTLVPYKTRTGDLAVIVASQDGTTVDINGAPRVLDRGESTSLLFFEASFVSADQPISVAHFSRSQSCDNTLGDPFFIMASPNEQMLVKATFNALEVTQIDNYFLNIVLETENVDRFTLDGESVSDLFTPLLTNLDYSYAQIDILKGNHTVESDSGFISYVYGFGNIESFGYSAGITLDNLNLDVVAFDPNSFASIPTDSICIGESVNILVRGAEQFEQYTWDFGDGTQALGDTISHAYSAPGDYLVEVTASTASGDCGVEEVARARVVVLDPSINILGPPSVCPNTDNVIYSVDGTDPRNLYDWVFNEAIVQNLDYDSVLLDWGATSSTAYIQVTTTNYLGCVGVPVVYPVKINIQLDPLLPIGGDSLCSSENIGSEYFVYNNPTSVYDWAVEGGTIAEGQGTNEIKVNWQDWGLKKISYEESSVLQDVCSGKSDTLDVYIEREPNTNIELNATNQIQQGDTLYFSFAADTLFQFASWDYGDGQSMDSLERALSPLSYLYNCPGNFELSLSMFTGTICQNVAEDIVSVEVLPPELLLDYVTVEDESIIVNWSLESSSHYRKSISIYRSTNDEMSWERIGSVSPVLSQYVDKEVLVDENYYSYYLSTLNDCEPLETGEHNSILLISEKEEDPKSTELLWNPYLGWGGDLDTYEIWVEKDELNNEVRGSTTSLDFIDPYENDGFNLCYRIKALKNGSEFTSWSNTTCQEFIPELEFYNIITPNGDLMNDSFTIENVEQYPGSQLSIFNRAGREVYSATGYKNDWAGTIKGSALPSGVYYYSIELNEPRNPKKLYKGILTIIR